MIYLRLRTFGLSLVALAVTVLPSPALAQEWQETDGARIRLVIEPPVDGATTVRGLLDVELATGWKTYWRDPGASGIPPTITIDAAASADFEAATLAFPAPVWIPSDHGAYAGYDRPVSFPVSFTLARPGLPADLSASVFLGVCDDVCIPVQMTFSQKIEAATGSSLAGARVAQGHAGLPKDAYGAFSVTALPAENPAMVRIGVTAPAPESLELFLFSADGTQFHPPKAVGTDGGMTVFEVSPLRLKDGGFAGPVEVTAVSSGLAVTGTIDVTILPAE